MKRLLMILIAALLLVPTLVFAQSSDQETTDGDDVMRTTLTDRVDLKAERRAEFNAARGQLIAARCDALKARIELLSGRIGGFKERRAQLVSNMVSKLEALITRLDDQDIDTADLAQDLATLKTMSGELATLWDTYQTAADALKQVACDSDSAEAFHTALEAAKAAMADVRSQYQAIKAFFLSDIKPDLTAIREAMADAESGGQ